MKRASRVLYLFHQSLTAPISRLHGLAQVVALSGERPFAVISYEPRNLSALQKGVYERTRSWLLEHGVPHTPVPVVGTRWLEIPMGAASAFLSCVFRGTRIIQARSYIPGLMALLATRVSPARFLFDMRGLFVDEYVLEGAFRPGTPRFRFARWLERRLLFNADTIIVVSERFRDHLLTREDLAGRVEPGRIVVIPNRVDLERFAPALESRERTRAELGWDDDLVFVYVGSTAPWHRLDRVAELMARVMERNEHIRLVASVYPDPSSFEDLALAAGVPKERMALATSTVDEIPRLLAAADVGLMLIDDDISKQVCAPIKFSEYMAAGLPVIAAGGIGDTRDWIEEEGLGILVDGEDVDAAAEAVVARLTSDAIVSARARCLDFAARALDMRQTLRQYEGVYRKLEGR